MKRTILLSGIIFLALSAGFSQVKSIDAKILSDFEFTTDDNSDGGPPWNYWMTPIGNASASSILPGQGEIDYEISNITDFNINTAWVEGKEDYGIGEIITFQFEFDADDPIGYFGAAYNFYGKCYILNGYYKTSKSWEENSRVKKFKVYFNDTPLCYVNIQDSREMQEFDLSEFFANEYTQTNLEKIKVINGDLLKFEIVDIYPGTKWKDTAITELIGEAMGN